MAPTSAVAAMAAAAAATTAAATVTAAKPESVPAKAIVFAIGTAIVVKHQQQRQKLHRNNSK